MPEDGETFACKYCEKEFDSKRGLHIHQSQVHPEEEKQDVEDTETEETESEDNESSDVFSEDDEELELEKTEEEFSVKAGKGDSTVNMSLTTRQVAAAALIVGLLVGGIIAGVYFSGILS